LYNYFLEGFQIANGGPLRKISISHFERERSYPQNKNAVRSNTGYENNAPMNSRFLYEKLEESRNLKNEA